MGGADMWREMEAYMKGKATLPPTKPRAILLVSAHWEEARPTVMSAVNPPMLYDY
jgi:aromatic ring-opening dioxygenase catalytic subunit (LigB family)